MKGKGEGEKGGGIGRLFIFFLCTFFFFQATYTLSRKIVRNRAVSSYRGVCMQKKKKTCALSGI